MHREAEAHGVASRLPSLLVEAMRVSNTIAHGMHGRRRAGPGETFWQFRQYGTNDDAAQIDWRRSASSDHLYIREREWEAAHTFWLWSDLSKSMDFKSHLSTTTKRDRALVLLLACVELLVNAGERVALLGLTRPTANRRATTRFVETLSLNADGPILSSPLPPAERLSRFSGTVLISDFLEPVPKIAERLTLLAANGISGHLVQVLDPAEEVLPYEGRAEFIGMSDEARWIADRTETLREAYQAKLGAHRAGLEALARSLGWSFVVHHTDRSATEPLLSLIMRLQAPDGAAHVTGARLAP
ncbi:MAG: DUF58 domain-containing protein [Pseudomonadota bacterium]